MRTHPPHDTPPARHLSAEKPHALVRNIRARLILRGTSLRAWTRAWALANGRNPNSSYDTARATLTRRVSRRLAPKGEIGRAIVDDLRRELGEEVVPLPHRLSTTHLQRSAGN